MYFKHGFKPLKAVWLISQQKINSNKLTSKAT